MCSTPRISFGERILAVEREHALGDILGEIADPLEIVGDAQRADDLAQIDRHRLPARDRQDRPLLDLALQRVDLARRRAITRCAQDRCRARQRIDRVGDLLFGEAAHLGDHAVELLQIGVEGLGDMFGHCCCVLASQPVSRSGR